MLGVLVLGLFNLRFSHRPFPSVFYSRRTGIWRLLRPDSLLTGFHTDWETLTGRRAEWRKKRSQGRFSFHCAVGGFARWGGHLLFWFEFCWQAYCCLCFHQVILGLWLLLLPQVQQWEQLPAISNLKFNSHFTVWFSSYPTTCIAHSCIKVSLLQKIQNHL